MVSWCQSLDFSHNGHHITHCHECFTTSSHKAVHPTPSSQAQTSPVPDKTPWSGPYAVYESAHEPKYNQSG